MAGAALTTCTVVADPAAELIPGNDFVVSPLSYYLREEGLGLSAAPSSALAGLEPGDMPTPLGLAYVTGYLVVVPRPTREQGLPAFEATCRILRQWGYTQHDVPEARGRYLFLIPREFTDPAADIDGLLDDQAAGEMQRWLLECEDLNAFIEPAIANNNAARTQVVDAKAALTRLAAEEDSLGAAVGALRTEVSDLQGALDQVRGCLSNLPALAWGLLVTERGEVPARVLQWDREKDFTAPVLGRHLVTIEDPARHPYADDRDAAEQGKITFKLLHSELASALDSFTKNEEATLRSLGVYPFKLVGAARSPMQQLSLRGENPLAASVLGSRHPYGMAADFRVPASMDLRPYYFGPAPCCRPADLAAIKAGKAEYAKNSKMAGKQKVAMEEYQRDPKAYEAKYATALRNWQRLGVAMSKYGLTLAMPWDCMHVDLTKFVSEKPADRAWADGIRLAMLSDYCQAITKELNVRHSLREKLEGEDEDLCNRLARLAKLASDANGRVAGLKVDKAKLEGQRDSLRREISRAQQGLA
ncbi:MAG: hypothetical protein WCP21_20775, partial [Armatimonadota bacterium]